MIQQETNLQADEEFVTRVRAFQEFLSEDHGESIYTQKILEMLQAKQTRLIVNINHIRTFKQQYADGLLNLPIEYLPAFEQALFDVVKKLKNPDHPVDPKSLYCIGIEGSFGANFCAPVNLNTDFLGKMVCMEGIATRCSVLRPKIARSVHYCEKTQVFHAREYQDGTTLSTAIPTGTVYPKEDEDGNPLVTEFGLCTYRAHQTISLQEMPERAPAGQLPRPIDVFLDNDLGNTVKPGDRIQVSGVYRSIGKHAASGSALFKTFILANNVRILGMSAKSVITDVDISDIKKIGKRSDVVDLLAGSIAPSIYGHDFIKKAVLLQLLGGLEKNLDNGTHIRGDINILLVGDPSTAKSQMLRFVLNIAPLAIATTGRGSSGVGLTAAVTVDQETGERRLEAGAMVLADRGIICIDEFDKMNDIDRVAIHEVMEQQTVTIAKAGIHTSLNARCSVLAAANPVFGQYLSKIQPTKNINLPDSLLSRFDLLFIVLDNLEDEHNRAIGEHLIRLHRYIPPGVEEGAPIPESYFNLSHDAEDKKDTTVFTKYNKLLHVGMKPIHDQGSKKGKSKKEKNNVELLSIGFLKKYIDYAKLAIKPTLTQDACDYICEKYAELRNREDGSDNMHKVMPITARTLETLIRLSTAHAKARLSMTVDKTDAESAMEIVMYALFAEVKPKERKRPKKQKKESHPDAMEESEVEEEEEEEEEEEDVEDIETEELAKTLSKLKTNEPTRSSQTLTPVQIESKRSHFHAVLHKIRTDVEMEKADAQMPVSELTTMVNSSSALKFTQEEIIDGLSNLEDTLYYSKESQTVVFF